MDAHLSQVMDAHSRQVMDVRAGQKDALPEGFVGRRTAATSDSG